MNDFLPAAALARPRDYGSDLNQCNLGQTRFSKEEFSYELRYPIQAINS